MNANFRAWIKYHGAAFPKARDFLKSNPESLSHWQAATEDFELAELKRATDTILRGDEPVFGIGDHIPTVCKIVKSKRSAGVRTGPKRIDGRDVFRCRECRDAGIVLVFAPSLVGELEEGLRDHEEKPWLKARKYNVACTCNAGDRWAAGSDRSRRLPRFDSGKFCAVGFRSNREAWKEFCEFAEKKANELRVPEFDAWNQTTIEEVRPKAITDR